MAINSTSKKKVVISRGDLHPNDKFLPKIEIPF